MRNENEAMLEAFSQNLVRGETSDATIDRTDKQEVLKTHIKEVSHLECTCKSFYKKGH